MSNYHVFTSYLIHNNSSILLGITSLPSQTSEKSPKHSKAIFQELSKRLFEREKLKHIAKEVGFKNSNFYSLSTKNSFHITMTNIFRAIYRDDG